MQTFRSSVGTLALLALVALAIFALPIAQGAGVRPPEIHATLSATQSLDRISYTLGMVNLGDLPAMDVRIVATLPNGFLFEDGTSTLFVAFPNINAGEQQALGFVAIIDRAVPAGTLAVVTARITYGEPGGTQTYETTAQSQLSVAERGGGLPILAVVAAVVGGILVLFGYMATSHAMGVRIDQLFLLHDSGMLIRHYSNGKGVQRDSDIMSGMLIILQEFVRDSFNDSRSSLEEMRFGDKRVLMARGQHSIMAAVVTGKRLNGLPSRLQRAVAGFELEHKEALTRWNGNLESLASADSALRSVLTPRYRGFLPT